MNTPSQFISLEDQIHEAELAVRERQRAVINRSSHLIQQLRKKMTSPVTLLIAFGGGFMIDRVIGLIPRRTKKTAPDIRTKPGLLARLMQITVLVRTLLTAWPAAMFRRFIRLGTLLPRTRPRSTARPGYPSNQNLYP